MVDRIKQVMEYEQMSPTAFADKININRSSLTHIFSGRNQPSLDVAKKILIAFPEISTEWLIMGMGNMIQEVPAPADTPTPVKTVDNMQQTDLFSGTEDGLTDQDVTETTETESIIDGKDVVEQEPAAQKTAPTEPQQAIVEPVNEEVVVNDAPTVAPTRPRGRGRASESHIPASAPRRDRISNSQGDKKLVKIVFFYEDRSFEEYRPM